MRLNGSIRLRLTLWYSVVLAAGLVLFGGGVWLSLRQTLYGSMESNLRQYVEGLSKALQAELAEGVSGRQLREELAEYARAVPDGFWLQAREAEGKSLLDGVPHGGLRGHTRTLSEVVQLDRRQYVVTGFASVDQNDAILNRLRGLMLLSIPAALILAGFGAYWLSRSALAPVDEVIAAARSITISNLSQRLPVQRTGDEMQRLAEAWNETLERLDRAVKRLAQFTADASHELRTPITLIRTSAEVALRRDRSPEEYREALRAIQSETERTSQLIDDLLTLARADAGVQPMAVARLDLAALVREAGEHARALAKGRPLSVSAEAPQDPVPIQGNEAGLRRLFSVLVENAVKYTPDGGHISLSLIQNGAGASVEVRDTGMGMSADVIPRIFERFYRADESRNRDEGGSGLGLSIAKWIAGRHEAEIVAESAVGKGSVFTVRFPARVP